MSSQRFSFTDTNISHLGMKMLYLASTKHNHNGEFNTNLHTHHFTEIYYITSGSGAFQIGEERFAVKENNLIIINPHIEHTEICDNSTAFEFISLGFEGMTFEFDKQFNNKIYGIYNCDSIKESMLTILNMLLAEAEDEHANYEISCQNLAEIFIIHIMRLQSLSLAPSLDTKMSKECGIAKRYIDSNYMENITLDLLAELTHMNKFYLVHSFTKYTGMSPINYLTQKRIRIAMEYLASTDYSIAQIASSVGFSSQSYFSQVFRKSLRMTPVQYRKQQVKRIQLLEADSE